MIVVIHIAHADEPRPSKDLEGITDIVGQASKQFAIQTDVGFTVSA